MKKKTKKVRNQSKALKAGDKLENGALDNAIFGNNPFGMYGTQLSQTETLWKTMRWYLISNQRNLLAEMYVELGLVQTICRVPVEDALRGWVDIKSKQLTEDQIHELMALQEREDDQGKIGMAAVWQRLYGGGAILIMTGQDPIKPLNEKELYETEFLEFKPVDMWELFYSLANIEEDGEPLEYQDSEYFNYYGQQIHHSRVLIMKGLEAPSYIRPRLRGWGMSVCETLVRSINQYIKSSNLTFEVMDEFKLDIFKIKNLANVLLGAGGQQKVSERIGTANRQKNYLNSIVLDSEDDYVQKQLSFAGLAEAQAGIRMQVASDMRMPLTKLFGISAAGFNSGEDDIEVYNGTIESEVRSRMKRPIIRMIELRCIQLYGFIPDDLTVDFKALRILSAEQEENVKDKKYARLERAREKGWISNKDFADGCNKDQLLSVQIDTDGLDEDSGAVDTGELSEDVDTDKDSVIDKKVAKNPKESKQTKEPK